MMNEQAKPRIWLVTGSATGFGRALVEQIIAVGDRVIATARRPETLADLESRAPDSVRRFALDVTQPAQIRAVVAEAAQVWGRLDVVVNNAGCGLLGALEECSDEQIERSFATNLLGPVHVMRAALPIFRAQRSGHFLNVSAAAAIANYPGFAIYGGAKWGLEGVSEALRAETLPLGIKVTLVEPGPFRTDFLARSLDRAAQPLPDYAGTSGKFGALLERVNGRQPGDPARAAHELVKLVQSGRAPLRLVLGKYAVEKTRRALKVRADELTEWEAVALAADFPAGVNG